MKSIIAKFSRRKFLGSLGCFALAGYVPLVRAVAEQPEGVEFLQRQHKLFDSHRRLFNKRIEIYPNTIALCTTEQGVQQAVRYANEHDLPISIKSGGHSFEGFCLNEGGMVIDVSNMTQLNLDAAHQLTAEPGVRLVQLYNYCLPLGRLLPSGSCASVGLAGITLGGGYGLFGRQFGLTCDYLTGVRMVDAEGTIVDSDQLPELLWACRGGGNGNFGVITQLRFNTVPAPAQLYHHRFRSFNLTPKRAAELAERWFEQCSALPLQAFSAFVLNGKTLTIMLTATAQDAKLEKILSALETFMEQRAPLKPDPLALGVQYYYGRLEPLYFKNISAGYYQNFGDIRACAEALFTHTQNTPGAVYQINTLGGEINNPARAKAAAYAHRQVNYLGEAQCYWEKPAAAARSLSGMKAIQDTLYDNNIRQHYVNYPDVNIRDYGQAYYGTAYKRLQKLKRRLDPKNRFGYQQGVALT
jgi:hypothetical protein